ncbi:hypothetical protein CRG98_009154 [Punica granatum]|uniref:Uncharacterized protein n=1 Tax=Punica granatum TaxID=22663 RepID=A0A2I0KQ60_PUNGR|nr:hypothetical protein CRG98_009153 [Punica granatum]PKI70454.1 hypothetical protein CRG98_009154 [Punica granatum]
MHFREARRTGVWLECPGGAWEASGLQAGAWARGSARGQARGARDVRAGHARVSWLAHGWHYSPESDDSSPEML